ncbi:MAG: methyltransferase, partial [Flavobacteriaceae bacterium]
MKSYLKTRDFSVSQEEFQLVYDEVNDWLATYSVPGNLDSYDQSGDYISHTDGNHSLIERLDQFGKKRNLLW